MTTTTTQQQQQQNDCDNTTAATTKNTMTTMTRDGPGWMDLTGTAEEGRGLETDVFRVVNGKFFSFFVLFSILTTLFSFFLVFTSTECVLEAGVDENGPKRRETRRLGQW